MAWLRSRSILGFGVNFLSLGLYFLLLGSIFRLGRGIFPFAFDFTFLPFSPLALVTSLAGSLRNFRKREGIWDSQRLFRGMGRRRRDRRPDFTNLQMVVDTFRQSPNKICRDSCNSQGPIPCHVAIVPAHL